jgi:hypothetical protein
MISSNTKGQIKQSRIPYSILGNKNKNAQTIENLLDMNITGKFSTVNALTTGS